MLKGNTGIKASLEEMKKAEMALAVEVTGPSEVKVCF